MIELKCLYCVFCNVDTLILLYGGFYEIKNKNYINYMYYDCYFNGFPWDDAIF